MKKTSESLIPWEARTQLPQDDVDHSEIQAFLDDFREVDIFAFLGVPDHSRDRYMREGLEILFELDGAEEVFAPRDYQDFLEEELRGVEINYHSPDSRKVEFQSIAEGTGDINTILAPTMDYTVPRNYNEAEKAFDHIQTLEDNVLIDFEGINQTDGSILSYLISDLNSINGSTASQASTEYEINDSDIVIPGINYSEKASDYFGLNFFSAESEAVRSIVPEKAKDIIRDKMRSGY